MIPVVVGIWAAVNAAVIYCATQGCRGKPSGGGGGGAPNVPSQVEQPDFGSPSHESEDPRPQPAQAKNEGGVGAVDKLIEQLNPGIDVKRSPRAMKQLRGLKAAGTKVREDPSLPDGVAGSFNDRRNVLKVRPRGKSIVDRLKTIFHEIGHAILGFGRSNRGEPKTDDLIDQDPRAGVQRVLNEEIITEQVGLKTAREVLETNPDELTADPEAIRLRNMTDKQIERRARRRVELLKRFYVFGQLGAYLVRAGLLTLPADPNYDYSDDVQEWIEANGFDSFEDWLRGGEQ